MRRRRRRRRWREAEDAGGKGVMEEEKTEPAFVPSPVEEKPTVSLEKVDVFEETLPPPEEEKKGFLDKIKEKLPGHGKKAAEEAGAVPPAVEEHEAAERTEGKEEKKGFLGKIIEKLPGYHKSAGEEAEKSPGSH